MRRFYQSVIAGAVLVAPLITVSRAAALDAYLVATDGIVESPSSTVVMARAGSSTAVSIQSAYEGTPAGLAIVIPVPAAVTADAVSTLDPALFEHLERLTAPRLIEYWEQDPCAAARQVPPAPSIAPPVRGEAKLGRYAVTVTGEESPRIATWLSAQNYEVPASIADALAPLAARGMHFVVARLEDAVPQHIGPRVLPPIQVRFESDSLAVPLLPNRPGASKPHETLLFVFAAERFDVAGAARFVAPTDVSVGPTAPDEFKAFYTSLIEETTHGALPNAVTEYVSDPTRCENCAVDPLTPAELEQLGVTMPSGPAPASAERVSEERATAPAAPPEGATQPADRGGAPGPTVKLENVSVVSGTVPTAADAVGTLRGPIAECYAGALPHDPYQRGTISLGLILHPSGSVGGAGVTTKGTLAKTTVNCVKARAREARFAAPEGKNPVVHFDVVLEPPGQGAAASDSTEREASNSAVSPPAPDSDVAPADGTEAPAASIVLSRIRIRSDAAVQPGMELERAPAIRDVRGAHTPGMPDARDEASQFRATYFIRHPWSGATSCAEPVRSVWGPPPGGGAPPSVTLTGPLESSKHPAIAASPEPSAHAAGQETAPDVAAPPPSEVHGSGAPRGEHGMSPEAQAMRKNWLVALGFGVVILLVWHTRQIA